MNLAAAGLAALFAILAVPATACGHCEDDKVAAAYDHAVVERALVQTHEMAFFSLELAQPATRDTEAAIRRAIERIPGVDRGSVRVALEAGGLSLAFDPKRVSQAGVLSALDRAVTPLGARTALLRFGSPGKT
jgi:copper chaperone CopZ